MYLVLVTLHLFTVNICTCLSFNAALRRADFSTRQSETCSNKLLILIISLTTADKIQLSFQQLKLPFTDKT